LRASPAVSCRAVTVAIVGSTVRDVVYLPGSEPTRKTGGSPLFAARALAALGVRPGIATRCDDPVLAEPIAELASPLCLKLDATVVQSVLHYREDGERDHELADIGVAWSAEDIETWAAPALAGATWVHAGTQRGGDLGPEVLVTFGQVGAAIASEEGSANVSSVAVSGVDPTGAGDAFLASYAHARARGTSPIAAGRAACESVSALLTARREALPQSHG